MLQPPAVMSKDDSHSLLRDSIQKVEKLLREKVEIEQRILWRKAYIDDINSSSFLFINRVGALLSFAFLFPLFFMMIAQVGGAQWACVFLAMPVISMAASLVGECWCLPSRIAIYKFNKEKNQLQKSIDPLLEEIPQENKKNYEITKLHKKLRKTQMELRNPVRDCHLEWCARGVVLSSILMCVGVISKNYCEGKAGLMLLNCSGMIYLYPFLFLVATGACLIGKHYFYKRKQKIIRKKFGELGEFAVGGLN